MIMNTIIMNSRIRYYYFSLSCNDTVRLPVKYEEILLILKCYEAVIAFSSLLPVKHNICSAAIDN